MMALQSADSRGFHWAYLKAVHSEAETELSRVVLTADLMAGYWGLSRAVRTVDTWVCLLAVSKAVQMAGRKVLNWAGEWDLHLAVLMAVQMVGQMAALRESS
jgi:hypothetical protein